MALKGIAEDYTSQMKKYKYCLNRPVKPFLTREEHEELHKNSVVPKVGSFAAACIARKAAQK